MNLIRFKRNLAFLNKAHSLLEEKRDILLLEVSKRLEEATRLRTEVNKSLQEAYSLLDHATVVVGSREIEYASTIPRITFDLVPLKRKIMGVTTISFELADTKRTVGYDISKPSILIDDASERFYQTMPLVIKTAELEGALIRLVGEVKKTQQRINALEQFLIPRYAAIVAMIASVLEERDREEFVRVKKVKSILEARAGA